MWPLYLSSPQVPVDVMSFLTYVFPPILGYFVMAALAVTPHTYIFRVVLWPVITYLALRATIFVDMSLGEPDRRFRNTMFTFSMIHIATRAFDWMSARKPLVRYQLPAKGSQSTIMDALDLATTLRGFGWDWARRVCIPHETRPTDRRGFIFHAILSGAVHALGCGILHISIRSFAPTGHGSLSGGSIFDDSLPFHVKYIRASVISACGWACIYTFIQMNYDAFTVIGVLILGHDPAQWPPAFDAPWRPTSVSNFWRRHWHQFFRRMFLIQGGYPLAYLFGRTGLVIGTFLSSGVLHYIALAVLDNPKLEPWRVIGGFGMMAPGVLAEEAFEKRTGRKVGGVWGWLWTRMWLLVWGTLIFDGIARAGTFGGYLKPTESVVPLTGRVGVECLVVGFDSWLHTM